MLVLAKRGVWSVLGRHVQAGSRAPVGCAPRVPAVVSPRYPAPGRVPAVGGGGCCSASSPVPVAVPG